MEVINFLLFYIILFLPSFSLINLILFVWKCLSDVNWKAFEGCNIKDKMIAQMVTKFVDENNVDLGLKATGFEDNK